MFIKILEKIKEYDTIIIHRHERPDGDCIGTQMGLYHLIKDNFKEKTVYTVGDELPDYLKLYGKSDQIDDSVYENALVITVDTSNEKRICDKRYNTGKYLIKIDHHDDSPEFGDIYYVDEKSPACASIMVDIYKAWHEYDNNIVLSKEAATSLMLGMVTDTGRFRYRGTCRKTLENAGLLLDAGVELDDLYASLYTKDVAEEVRDKYNVIILNEAKNNTEFISDISHQLKTPLAGLRLYCEMEHNSNPTSYTEKELQLVEKMEKLIHNVLKLEKIRSDTYVMNFERNEISLIFEELKTEFATLFPQKQISIDGKGTLRCDKSWLREAFGNIIKNACEHTTADGKIDISIEQAEKSISVIIEDNGGGVPENELPLLFKRFHRTENASPDSAGIGLSITKAIIEKHHGTIIAENGEKGLRFSICFPIIDANLKL